jgi:hypothetical protein
VTRFLFALGAALALCASAAPAAGPPPIKLWLTPAKPPTPALKYQLLPDARVATSGNAADVYREVIEQLNKTSLTPKLELFSGWAELPLNALPKEDVRKELAPFDKVCELLDKGARCEHCDWGIRDRLREKGIAALLPEIQPMRECATLLRVKAHLEMADGRFDKALLTLRTGFALARHVGESETLICFLVGVAIANMMESELDQLISCPDAPNLYYALTDLPAPPISMRKALESERLWLPGTFPGLGDVVENLDAGPLPEEKLKDWAKVAEGLSNDKLGYAGRVYLAWNIRQKHEIAKKALIAAGRPRDKVKAMPHLQVAMLHAVLEYDAALDNLLVWEKRPYWERNDPETDVNKRYLKDRWKYYDSSAIPLTPLVMPAVKKVSVARVRLERKTALLRTVEALRLHAATHDGKLPASLAAVTEVPLPRDPFTGKSFEYELRGDVAQLRGPPPAGETPSANNTVVYLLKVRQRE